MPPPSVASRPGAQGRRWLCACLLALTLFLLGTVLVLSTAVAYFGIHEADVITDKEMDRNQRAPLASQRVPKIVHQTWRSENFPQLYRVAREACQALHPDYEYMLWTDISSREFIASNYRWFLSTFDGYPHPIQRADAIRYFVLHYYGGIYMDLDVGCQQRMDPLLYFPVVLPATVPVGVSNDVMLAEKGHPFFNLAIHNLIPFNHIYATNYPTVMFSTGPMFLSAQVGIWNEHESSASSENRQVRILPRRWYGKHAPQGERALAYFSHSHGSSWHSDDAGFIVFLGRTGCKLIYLGFAIVLLGAGRLLWISRIVLKDFFALEPAKLPLHISDPHGRPSWSSSPLPSRRAPRGHRHGHESHADSKHGEIHYIPVWLPAGTPVFQDLIRGWTPLLGGLDVADVVARERAFHPLPDYAHLSPHTAIALDAVDTTHILPSSPRPRRATSPDPSYNPPTYTTAHEV